MYVLKYISSEYIDKIFFGRLSWTGQYVFFHCAALALDGVLFIAEVNNLLKKHLLLFLSLDLDL